MTPKSKRRAERLKAKRGREGMTTHERRSLVRRLHSDHGALEASMTTIAKLAEIFALASAPTSHPKKTLKRIAAIAIKAGGQ